MLTQPTGAIFNLEPMRGNAFRIKERSGWSLDFKRAPDGSVSEAVLHQSGASSVLKRQR